MTIAVMTIAVLLQILANVSPTPNLLRERHPKTMTRRIAGLLSFPSNSLRSKQLDMNMNSTIFPVPPQGIHPSPSNELVPPPHVANNTHVKTDLFADLPCNFLRTRALKARPIQRGYVPSHPPPSHTPHRWPAATNQRITGSITGSITTLLTRATSNKAFFLIPSSRTPPGIRSVDAFRPPTTPYF